LEKRRLRKILWEFWYLCWI